MIGDDCVDLPTYTESSSLIEKVFKYKAKVSMRNLSYFLIAGMGKFPQRLFEVIVNKKP